MDRRRLGRTGFEVGAIGIGTRGIAGDIFRDGDRDEARRAVYHAVERGIDLIDTSPAWGAGETERLVGEVVRDLRARDRVVVVTRVPPAARQARAVQDFVERSLRATRLEAIPIELLDGWDDAWLDDAAWPELRGTLERLVREGKVQSWGIVVGDGGAVRGLAEPVFAAACVRHDLFGPDPGAALPIARAHDVGVIVRQPLAEGALGGELGADVRWHRDDIRVASWPPARRAELAVRLAALAELVAESPPGARSTDPGRERLERAEAARGEVEAQTIVELALRFALARDEVGAVTPGMRTRAHVDFNLPIADGRRPSPELLERLAEQSWARDRVP